MLQLLLLELDSKKKEGPPALILINVRVNDLMAFWGWKYE
jgi:hypothetical protein